MRSLRIVHVADAYQPQLSYQESELARWQQRLGHCVIVVTASDAGSIAGEVGYARQQRAGTREEDGVTVQRLPVRFRLPGADNRVWLAGLRRVLAELRPQVVHVHNFTTFTAARVAQWKTSLGYRLIYDNHQSWLNIRVARSPLKRVLRDSFYELFRRTAAPYVRARADALVAVGEHEQDFLAEYLSLTPEAIHIIRLGADMEVFKPDAAIRQQQRQAWGISDTDVVLIHAGQYRPGKKLELLLRAAEALSAQRLPAFVVLVGGGYPDYQRQLQAQAAAGPLAGRIIFEPFAEREVLAQKLCAADIGVWPGFHSITYIQGMATGLPIVAVRSPYNVNTIADAGCFFAGDNMADLVATLGELVRNRVLRADLSQRALARVQTELNWDVAAQRFLQLYAG